MTDPKANEKADELFWLETRRLAYKALGNQEEYQENAETFAEKGVRKFKQNPFVPIGVLVTTYVLFKGLLGMRKNSPKLSQFWMRARLAAQGFTIVAMAFGAIYYSDKKEQKTQEASKQQ